MSAADSQPLPRFLDRVVIGPTRPRAPVLDLDALDRAAVAWMERHGTTCLRVSLALVFGWFGALKLVGLSPADGLVQRTVSWWDPAWFIPFLGAWECLIGVCFLVPRANRLALVLMATQMAGTFLPFIVLPAETYTRSILVPTIEGQYIIKNVVLIAAAIAVGSRVRDDGPRRT